MVATRMCTTGKTGSLVLISFRIAINIHLYKFLTRLGNDSSPLPMVVRKLMVMGVNASAFLTLQ